MRTWYAHFSHGAMNEWHFASNKLCGIKSKALLKSVITVPTTEFLHLEVSHEPGFKSFPTLKLKNSRVGRGLISQVIPSAVTNVGC